MLTAIKLYELEKRKLHNGILIAQILHSNTSVKEQVIKIFDQHIPCIFFQRIVRRDVPTCNGTQRLGSNQGSDYIAILFL